MTPGAGHALGKGVGGSGGGGGGVELGWGLSSGLVVKGCDWASLNRAQPLDTSVAAHSTASARRTDHRIRMTDRLRTVRAPPPHCPEGVRRQPAGFSGQRLRDLGHLRLIWTYLGGEVPIVWRKAPLKSPIQA